MEEVGSESAQAIIIGGFLIAIGMISVATILNGMIFSQNIDARDVQVDDDSIIDITESTAHETRHILNRTQYLNKSGSFGFGPREPAVGYYNRSMYNYMESLQALPSNSDASVSGEASGSSYVYFATTGLDSPENILAWQFLQNDTTRRMTDDSGTGTWQMTNPSPGEGVGQFLMMDFVMGLTSSDPVTIQVNDSSGNRIWNMSYSPNDSPVPAPITPPGNGNDFISVCDSTNSNCETYDASTVPGFNTGDRIKVEVLEGNGRINDTPVNLLAKEAGLDTNTNAPYEVGIKHGDRIEAAYEVRGKEYAFDAPNDSPGLCGARPCAKSNRRVAGIVHKVGYNLTYTGTQSTHVARVNETLPPQVAP
jgi:hypothetical protein